MMPWLFRGLLLPVLLQSSHRVGAPATLPSLMCIVRRLCDVVGLEAMTPPCQLARSCRPGAEWELAAPHDVRRVSFILHTVSLPCHSADVYMPCLSTRPFFLLFFSIL